MNSKKFITYFRLMRIHKPIPILLIFFPLLIIIFSQFLIDIENQNINEQYIIQIIKLISISFIGSIITRSLGCIINDIFDKDIDSKTERVKIRPLASHESYKPTKFGISILLITLTGISLLLAYSLGKVPFIISILSGILVLFYPLTKRFFFLPQLFLGITYNLGIIIICSAVDNWINFSSLLFYIINIIWTFNYDTVYAMQDVKDDKKNKLYSSAIFLEQNFIEVITKLYNLITILLLIFSFSIGGKIFYLSLLIFFIFHKKYIKELSLKNNYQEFFNKNWKLFGILASGNLLDLFIKFLTHTFL